MNYQIEMEKIIRKENGSKKKLLIHSCCGPCSSYVLEYLHSFFDITIYYYNPNICDQEEFNKRANTQKEIIDKLNLNIKLIIEEYDNSSFIELSKNLENEPEKGKRCYSCYEDRLDKTAKYAITNDYDYFATTLTVSPYKVSKWVNEIGEKLKTKYQINYLYSDFKKKNGYKKSLELSNNYNLYRQDFCGCIYSKNTFSKK